MPNTKSTFAEWLTFWIKCQNHSQTATARQLGVSQATISNWLAGAIPDGFQLQKVAEATQTNPIELFQLCGYLPREAEPLLGHAENMLFQHFLSMKPYFDQLDAESVQALVTVLDTLIPVLLKKSRNRKGGEIDSILKKLG